MFTQGSDSPERATPGGGAVTAVSAAVEDAQPLAGDTAGTATGIHDDTCTDSMTAFEDVTATTSAPVATIGAIAPPPHWRSRYQRFVIAIDLVAAVVGVAVGFVERFGGNAGAMSSKHVALAVALPVIWLCCAGLNRAYEARFLGAGTIEFERVGRAFLHLVALTAFAAYATKADVSRGFILIALPTTLALSVLGRYGARKSLHHRRKTGGATVPVVAVGAADEIARFSDTLRANEHAGMCVAAACITQPDDVADVDAAALVERGISRLGDLDSIREAVVQSGARSVAVISRDISGETLRWISWQLEGTETDLVVLPGLTEVAGRRLHIQQVAGLPLLYVAEPEFRGMRRVVKAGFDRTTATLGLLLFAPLFVCIAIAVRLTSRGPALFLQTRVGKDGKTFRMIKFRSMCRGAEYMVLELNESNDSTSGPLFKMREDPRVTRIGKFLRRYSLDELPQLFNVLAGSMSLVGPRPPLPGEVATYGGDVRRRLLVKPGLTGLWQISGRSDLDWEESVRLDLRYVESWSLTLDLVVMLKTVRAVVRGTGAY